MRLLMLPRYSRQGANSRYRLWQFIPGLESAGHQVDVKPMLGDRYLEQLYRQGVRPLGSIIAGYARHLSRLTQVHRYDAVILDQELLPYLPPVFEQWLCLRNANVMVDYDDAAYLKYERYSWLRGRIGAIMKAARATVVGNRHLEAYARQFSGDVRFIPTVVDVGKYAAKSHAALDAIRICWIGTPLTAAEYLPALLPVFVELQRRFPQLSFRLIGAGRIAGADAVNVEIVDWSEEKEAELIAECDIGIMPLPDSEFQRGKCGLKLIQYMAAGLPVVASPVGENRYIVDHGQNGFLASDASEWVSQLELLIRDTALRARMGASGRERVEQRYSLAQGLALWTQLLDDLQHAGKKAVLATPSRAEELKSEVASQ